MIELKGKTQSTNSGYDEYISKYVAHVNDQLESMTVRKGEFRIKKANGAVEKIDCVSIDSIPGLPEGFRADLIPRSANGGYYLDLIVYTDKAGKDKYFSRRNGTGQARVEFGSDITSAIYEFLMKEPGMQDLTLMPIIPKDDEVTISEKISRIHQRLVERKDELYLYHNSNINDRSAFTVHIPHDPYQAIFLVKKWLEAMKHIKDVPSNKQNH